MNRNSPMKWRCITSAGIAAALLVTGCRSPRGEPPRPRQGKFSQYLLDHMASVPTNDLTHIVVTLDRQLDETRKRALFQRLRSKDPDGKSAEQRQAVIQELKSMAADTQPPVLTYLRQLETNGVVREVRSIWIANAICMAAPASVVSNLARLTNVSAIDLDQPITDLQQASSADAWGITKIAVPDLSPESIRQTVVVAVVDSGVDHTHRDLASRIWRNAGETGTDARGRDKATNGIDDDTNGYPDDVMGWNFSGTGTDLKGTNGHGTEVAGIVAGDGTSGVRTGVAPQAQIMVLRKNSLAVRATERECWLAMQYALENRAHIVNLSAGWMDTNGPAYGIWRDAVQNLTDAGLLFVTGAGNVGRSTSAPYSVLTPGRVPAALTVGRIAKNDSIPVIGCKGPVTWTNLATYSDYPHLPGLVKPDLVAPSEALLSTRLADATGELYIEGRSGSSYAVPHVSGVAALLLALHPSLGPYELRYILEESAFPIGEPRPNTNSGWGRVDATKALELAKDYLESGLPKFDLSVVGASLKKFQDGKPPLISATLTNRGGQVAGNTELRFYSADAEVRSLMDLDPNQDGQPDDANFDYIGSYFVPVLGPSGSKHDNFQGVVRWNAPANPRHHWWIGVWALPGATGIGTEANPRNNGAVFQIPETGGN